MSDASAPAIRTYADGFGKWHANIPVSPDDRTPMATLKRRAAKAIRDELRQRSDIGPGYRLTLIHTGMTYKPSTGGFWENFEER